MEWVFEQGCVDWNELAELYRIAPLGDKKPDALRLAFSNSLFKCFVYENGALIGAGRAVADGVDCSYICDVAIHPGAQGKGVGRDIILKLTEMSAGHKKIILYANPGKEGFYAKLGFLRMRTAMAIFQDQQGAIDRGVVEPGWGAGIAGGPPGFRPALLLRGVPAARQQGPAGGWRSGAWLSPSVSRRRSRPRP